MLLYIQHKKDYIFSLYLSAIKVLYQRKGLNKTSHSPFQQVAYQLYIIFFKVKELHSF